MRAQARLICELSFCNIHSSMLFGMLGEECCTVRAIVLGRCAIDLYYMYPQDNDGKTQYLDNWRLLAAVSRPNVRSH